LSRHLDPEKPDRSFISGARGRGLASRQTSELRGNGREQIDDSGWFRFGSSLAGIAAEKIF
jgi:hypothetical protein